MSVVSPSSADIGPVRMVAGAALVAGLAVASSASAQAMPDQDFVNAAAQSNAYEIAAGQLVLTQSTDPEVKRFAQLMIQEHQKTTADLAAAAQASGLQPPPSDLGGDQQKMLSGLQSQTGADLVRSFWTQQVNAHAAALIAVQGYLATGSNPNLRKSAQAAVPVIEHHLVMARQKSAG